MKKLLFVLSVLWVASLTSNAQDDKKVNEQDHVFVDYEENAQFPGGEQECFKFLAANVKYPAECIEKGIQGRVIVSFIIETDGTVDEIKTMRSPDPLLTKEAERVVALMPKWKPFMQNGKPVRSRYTLPVMFRLNTDKPQKPDSLKANAPAAGEAQAASTDDDRIYDIVETNAEFPGGQNECYKFLASQVKYPVKCMQEGIQGRVIVSFVVNRDGSIVEVKTTKSPHPALSKEAERVISLMPKWKPAVQGGKTVRSRFNLPVMFRLSSN